MAAFQTLRREREVNTESGEQTAGGDCSSSLVLPLPASGICLNPLGDSVFVCFHELELFSILVSMGLYSFLSFVINSGSNRLMKKREIENQCKYDRCSLYPLVCGKRCSCRKICRVETIIHWSLSFCYCWH